MRSSRIWVAVVLVASLSGVSALAQTPPPPPPPPPSEFAPPPSTTPPPYVAPTPAPAPNAPPSATDPSASSQQEANRRRYSRFSAGGGGPLLVFSQGVTGAVGGGLIGGSTGSSDYTYLGIVTGGFGLATIGAIYQYYVPVGGMTSVMAALGSGVGFMLGTGIGTLQQQNSSNNLALYATLGLIGSQVGVLGVLMPLLAVEDLSPGDAGIIGAGALYGFSLTGLVLWIATANQSQVDARALLFAPAIGMAVGGILASAVDIDSRRILKITLIPLSVGLGLLLLGSIAQSRVIAPATALVGVVASFAMTVIFTAPDPMLDQPPGAPPPRTDRGIPTQLSPTVLVAPSGRRGEGVVAGPAVFGTF